MEYALFDHSPQSSDTLEAIGFRECLFEISYWQISYINSLLSAMYRKAVLLERGRSL